MKYFHGQELEAMQLRAASRSFGFDMWMTHLFQGTMKHIVLIISCPSQIALIRPYSLPVKLKNKQTMSPTIFRRKCLTNQQQMEGQY